MVTVGNTGLLTAKAVAGTVNITITTDYGSKTVTCKVTVTKPVTSFMLIDTTIIRRASKATATIIPAIMPSDAGNKAMTLTSSNTAVATVVASGTPSVTALQASTDTITATTTDGSNISKTCTVTVL